MKVPMKWLGDVVATSEEPREIARRLTMAGLEAEKVEHVPEGWDNVFVAHVAKVEKHPDADRLNLVDVEAGEHRLRVVTGAPNIAKGQKVALALAGARLIDPYAETPTPSYKTLKPGKIRGIVSEGMVCSERELGLSDEHEGIMVLPEDAPVGMPLKDYLGDTVIEFEITPNLVHAFSVVGIAKQYAALTGDEVTPPPGADLAGAPASDGLVGIEDADLCPRFTGATIEGVKVGPSPDWMQRRLTHAGLRPINNMVDITNYVMLEYGQPLHAYDRNRLAGGCLTARRAKPGETIETLDHQRRELTPDMLVIADRDRAVGVAGVMGGVESEVADDTTEILLEAANFEMTSIRHTRQALKLRTDASARFERGIDPNLASVAAARAIRLILDVCPGARLTGWQDVYPEPVRPRSLTMPFGWFERVLGVAYDEATVTGALARLGLAPEIDGPDGDRQLTVTIPTERKDLTIREDIVEEVARVVGYETLPETLLGGRTPEIVRDRLAAFQMGVRQSLVAAGAWECVTYSTVSEAMLRPFAMGDDPVSARDGVLHRVERGDLVRLVNPLQADRGYLRPTLVPSLLEVAAENRKHAGSVRLFEVARVYLPQEGAELPREVSTLGIVTAGRRDEIDRFASAGALDYFDLKGVIDTVLGRAGVLDDARFERPEGDMPGFHPGRTATIRAGETLVGVIGELRPDVAAGLGFEDERVAVAELDVEALFELASDRKAAVSVPHFLPVEQDFAIVVERQTPAADVERALRAGAGPLVKRVVLFDLFEGEQIGEGKKSLAFRVVLEAPDRALTDDELVKTRKRIEKTLAQRVGGALRG